jgi:hypothetical protein
MTKKFELCEEIIDRKETHGKVLEAEVWDLKIEAQGYKKAWGTAIMERDELHVRLEKCGDSMFSL